MGSWEKDAYRAGTLELASAIAGKKDAFSIVGGDGLLQVLDTAKMRSRMPQVSAGAAVWMAALSGQPLPSLQVMAARGKGWHGEERRATPRNS
jgi:3-phosphoglycerate kinase